MIVVMKHGAQRQKIDNVIAEIRKHGFNAHLSEGQERTIIGVVGDGRLAELQYLENLPGVDSLVRVLKPFKLVGRDFQPENTVVKLDGVEIGGNAIVVIAGPCAIESEEQLYAAAQAVSKAGLKVLRGGAFKPRSSPYSFQGLGEEGLKLMAKVKKEFGLLSVTEALSPAHVELVAEYSDMVQIGARNMQTFALLREVGRIDKPVLLKRGMMNSIEELLLSAEYIAAEGNRRIVLCERGIRTFENYTRSTLDVGCVPVCKRFSHLPVIVDPSHASGTWSYVGALSCAAIAAGADGLLVEIHPDPAGALCDGKQSLRLDRFQSLVSELSGIAGAVGRTL
jgi:3-deoxy-7-phosphoheptulonate synthase